MDSCVTGFNENLSIELVKFTFGIFNSRARAKDYTWRNLGAVPQFHKVKAKAAELLEKSDHLDARGYLSYSDSGDDSDGPVRKVHEEFDFGAYIDSDGSESDICNVEVPDSELQDLHSMLQVILGGLKRICRLKDGFEWDLYYKKQLHRVQFIPFIAFFKGDTVEHDKLTGRFGSRTNGVKSLCRYCTCPMDETDLPYADHDRKSPDMLTPLIRKKDLEALKNLSQHRIFNVFYDLPFGLHNNLGIHGACAMEVLHWLQLGLEKYGKGSFFEQTGEGTKTARSVNSIAAQMGYLFKRQSDRDLPRTKFTKGLQKGKLMAHKMTGVILVLLAVLTSTAGREAIMACRSPQEVNFPDEQAINDWISLLELLLQFEEWLKQPSMRVDTVMRLRTKVREFMTIFKSVANRQTGMGLRTNCFHATKHVPEDILFFGPPHCVNTNCNESHHKPDKKSAKRTQKRPESFDIQCSQRVEDRRLVEMGMEELKGRPRWDYSESFMNKNRSKSTIFEQEQRNSAAAGKRQGQHHPLTGVITEFSYCNEADQYVGKVFSQMKMKRKYRYPPHVEAAINDLAAEVEEYMPSVNVFSEYYANTTQTFRASPYYQKKPWYDWAIYRFDTPDGFDDALLPIHLRCFVDLRLLPPENNTRYRPGIYCLAETVRPNPEAEQHRISRMFLPYLKSEGQMTANKLSILPITDIIGPTCVIPDLSHPSRRAFLRLINRSDWPHLLDHWVHQPFFKEHNEPPLIE